MKNKKERKYMGYSNVKTHSRKSSMRKIRRPGGTSYVRVKSSTVYSHRRRKK